MTFTKDYSSLHRAMVVTSVGLDLAPMDLRFLLAIHERGGSASTDQLADDLCLVEMETQIRRALIRTRNRRLVTGGDKRGMRLPIHLTPDGQQAVSVLLKCHLSMVTNKEE